MFQGDLEISDVGHVFRNLRNFKSNSHNIFFSFNIYLIHFEKKEGGLGGTPTGKRRSLTCFLLLPVERIPKCFCLFFFLFWLLGIALGKKQTFFLQNLTPTPTLTLTPTLTGNREGFLGEAVAIISCMETRGVLSSCKMRY